MAIELVRRGTEKSDGNGLVRRGGQAGIEIPKKGTRITSSDVLGSTGSVYLVIDCSSSMANNSKLEKIKGGALDFAKYALSMRYGVGIITFANSPEHICEPQQSILTLQDLLSALRANGSTNMTDTIRLAAKNLKLRPGERIMNIVTDGMPNDQESALAAAKEAKDLGIKIQTIGTDDADEEFLRQLASEEHLSRKVENTNLQEGIASMAKMLPAPGALSKK